MVGDRCKGGLSKDEALGSKEESFAGDSEDEKACVKRGGALYETLITGEKTK